MAHEDHGTISGSALLVASVMFLFIGLFATLGNLLTAVALSTSRLCKSAATLLVISLCISILPICLFTMPFMAALCLEEILFHPHCISVLSIKAFYILTNICNQIELHTITVLAFNRACAVCLPTFYDTLNTQKVKWSTMVVMWTYSILLWVPVSVGVWAELEPHENTFIVHISEEYLEMKLVHIFFVYVLPFVVAVGCHIAMFYKVAQTKLQSNSTQIHPWQNHVTRTMTIIFVLQWVFSVPHFIVHILKRRGSWPRLWLFLHVLYFFRFCINPIVYIYSSQCYRKDCFRILKKIFPCQCLESSRPLECEQNEFDKSVIKHPLQSSCREETTLP